MNNAFLLTKCLFGKPPVVALENVYYLQMLGVVFRKDYMLLRECYSKHAQSVTVTSHVHADVIFFFFFHAILLASQDIQIHVVRNRVYWN